MNANSDQKKDMRGRKWMGTWNNPEEPENLDSFLRKLVDTGGA